MLLNRQEVFKKINKEEVHNHVEPYQFPDPEVFVNGKEFWDEKVIDKWIFNYCIKGNENDDY